MMGLSLLVVPITFLLGFLLGWRIRSVAGLVMSVVAGSVVYISGLIVLAGSASVFTFDVYTQMLMVAFGALISLFGWVIGANLEYLRIQKKRS